MKLKFVFAFIAVSLAACSSDDSAPVNSVNEKQLKEVISTRDNGQSGESLKFENNKVKERYLFNETGVYFEDLYSYDNEGRLYKRFVTTADFEAEQTIVYDDFERISYITTETIFDGASGVDVEERSFDYSIANKVIETTIRENQPNSIYTFDLDNNGRVYRVTEGSNNSIINEATFTGNNTATQTYFSYNTPTEFTTLTNTFTYDMTTEVKGEFLKISTNRYGNYIANEALFNHFVSNARNNYVSQVVNDDSTTTYQYQFDADGFPVNVDTYENGVVYRTTTITYQ